jgi:hypothetical protein
MKPINYIDDKIDKKENTNVESICSNNDENNNNDNMMIFDICNDKYNNKNQEIKIEVNDNPKYNIFQKILFSDNLPNQMAKTHVINHDMYEKSISIPQKILKKSKMSKPYKEVIFD